jgi:glycosyltransferase involved in cell wall biosynthesis
VFCVSHSLREVAVNERLCRPEKIVVLAGGSGNGVDATNRFNPDLFGPQDRQRVRDRFGIPNGAFVVGFVGRLVRDKGIIELEEAWRRLSVLFPEIHLLLVGPFEPRDPVPKGVKTRLISDPRIHLTNEHVDPAPLYTAMDLVVLPTYREGFPNVPLEAAAMRLPVVATSVPGCVDAVQDGVTGTLVPAQDTAALAEAIDRYIHNPFLRKQHGKAGRARVLREFRQEVIWDALFQEYSKLLFQKGAPCPNESASHE